MAEHAGPPEWLTTADVVALFAIALGIDGSEARRRLRSESALDGAVARPRTYAEYRDADLALQAAALGHGVAQSQAFVDGNTRAALMAVLVFLDINGFHVAASDREMADWIERLSGGLCVDEFAQVLRRSMTRRTT
jgi:death-on-curing protein